MNTQAPDPTAITGRRFLFPLPASRFRFPLPR